MEPTNTTSTEKKLSNEIDKATGKAQAAVDSATSKAKSAVDDATTKAKSAVDDATKLTKSAVDTAEEKAKQVAEELADRARGSANRAAESVSDVVNNASEKLREAADSMRDGTFQERTFGQMTKSLADISDAVQNKDLNELTRDVGDFARRHPVVFVGGLALLGFAAARMLADSEESNRTAYHDVHDLDRNYQS